MNILEFIRKNSILVLIVIVGIGAGLIMLDYGQKSSSFSRDFYVQVNGTNYSYPEVHASGSNARAYVGRILDATRSNLREKFDADGNEELSETELATMQSWLELNPQVQASMGLLQNILNSWTYGYATEPVVNIAANRAILNEEAQALGIYPSKEQIDAYIEKLPAFTKADGSFNTELYRYLCGYRGEVADNTQQRAFRSLIADMMVWEAMRHMLTDGMSFNAAAESALMDIQMQDMSGRTAWLAAASISAPAEPNENETKAYWEENKSKYLSAEKRVMSLYTLTPAEGTTLDELLNSADLIMQDIAQSNGHGIEKILDNAAKNSEYAPFSYKTGEGKDFVTFEACTRDELPEGLQAAVIGKDGSAPLGELGFTVEGAPTMAEYTAAPQDQKAGIRAIRGFLPTEAGTLLMLRVEAVQAPEELPFEQAAAQAKLDCMAAREANALVNAAKKLNEEMLAANLEAGLDAAFAKAEAAGAQVTTYGPISLELNDELPEGLDPMALMKVKKGELTPMVILTEGARVSSLEKRSFEDSPERSTLKSMMLLPYSNRDLREKLMLDWIHSAYTRYNVQLNAKATESKKSYQD